MTHDGDVPLVPRYLGAHTKMTVIGVPIACGVLMLAATRVS